MKMPEKFTEQSLIEYVVPLLFKQRCKSSVEIMGDTHCKYNSDNGRHCAIGFIIPVEIYDPNWDLEGLPVREIYKYIPSISDMSLGLLTDLQGVHDSAYSDFNTIQFKRDLEYFCKVYELDSSFLEKLDFIE